MHIVADNKIPYLKGVLEPFATVTYLPGAETTASMVKNANALLTRTRTRCNKELLDDSSVQFIASATVGFDHIDTEYCNNKGIVWTNAPGCNSGSVMQYVAAALSFLSLHHGLQLKGKTIAIIGVGNVGKKVLRLAELLQMKPLPVDPPRAEQEPGTIFYDHAFALSNADIITYHTPYTCDGKHPTHHLFNHQSLELIRPGAIVINTSRGEVTQTQALIEGRRNHTIKHLVLDVWENEPLINTELLPLCTLATPHIAGYSADSKAIGTQMSIRALARFFQLPLENWEACSIPKPENPNLDWDNHASVEKNIALLLMSTYAILSDDARFRREPKQFEEQRGNYPLRREMNAYRVSGHPKEMEETLLQLGFRI